MSNRIWTAGEIEKWGPSSLSEVVGNYDAKDCLYGLLRLAGDGPNTMIVGGSGNCKTMMINAFIKTLICSNISGDPPEPCRKCDACRSKERCITIGNFFALPNGMSDRSLSWIPINCANMTLASFERTWALMPHDGFVLLLFAVSTR